MHPFSSALLLEGEQKSLVQEKVSLQAVLTGSFKHPFTALWSLGAQVSEVQSIRSSHMSSLEVNTHPFSSAFSLSGEQESSVQANPSSQRESTTILEQPSEGLQMSMVHAKPSSQRSVTGSFVHPCSSASLSAGAQRSSVQSISSLQTSWLMVFTHPFASAFSSLGEHESSVHAIPSSHAEWLNS